MKQQHDDLHTLTAAYALHALDNHERQAFTTHLTGCTACRSEVAEFEATAARMAAATAHIPPASLKPKVVGVVNHVRQLPPRLADTGTHITFWTVLRGTAAPIAVAASLIAVAFAGVATWQHQESQEAGRRATQSEQRLDELGAVLAAPDARPVHGRASNGAVTTVVASKQLNKAVFTATRMPDPGPGKTYQLWLGHDGIMRPAGLIQRDGTVILNGNTAGANTVGLTLEPVGGSLQPTTAPLLLLVLPT
ncbi:anti-sigma factor [Streptomyces sp. H34-S4]|uniref:anti-sigma factor n=1 Tax=Streptomyces sp. H34-S4 TaxID=2996463 RepID=UPI00226E6D97|nr:anti-sigma factor [Streptomyces sp. H34-S4]MCY0937562.1 anti-sigma factor [Streptomyces sp. H34-S4]